MPRLSDRAFDILAAEVKRLCTHNPLEQVRQDIVLRRLDKFRTQDGAPLTLAEMSEVLGDIFPDFSKKVLKQAAKANRPPSRIGYRLGCVGGGLLGTAALAGSLWILNLPYPMIRWPVARVAPIVLLPSFMQMDYSYRQAISLVEQADQLVNQATSPRDIELGAEKVAAAQEQLDRLPVWFLGYYPQRYCTLFSCAWQFTYDEFVAARKAVGRMEAKVFQFNNAQTLLEEAVQAVEEAKASYQTAETLQAETAALTAWQLGMDLLREIPAETLAGQSARTKLAAYERDYEASTGLTVGGDRATTFIQVAKGFAGKAAQKGQNLPHSEATWRQIADLWQDAIARLEEIPSDNPDYAAAQSLLVEYKDSLGIVEEWIQIEASAAQAFSLAQRKQEDFLSQNLGSTNPSKARGELQAMLNHLSQVRRNTTFYEQAQNLQKWVLAQLNSLPSES